MRKFVVFIMAILVMSFVSVTSEKKILIDDSHESFPVKNNRFEDFEDLAREKGFLVEYKCVCDADLPQYAMTVVANPSKRFSPEEISKLKQYVDGGGILLIAGSADYKNRDYSEVTNEILEGIGADLRFNDDEVVDNEKNTGRYYIPLIQNYTDHELTKGLPSWGFYSTQSIIIKGDAISLANGNSTSKSQDTDKNRDAIPVSKISVLAIDPTGSGLIIAAGTWRVISDFRYQGGREFSENLLNFLKGEKSDLKEYVLQFSGATIVVGEAKNHGKYHASRDEVDKFRSVALSKILGGKVLRDSEGATGDLVLIGGPATNALTDAYNKYLPIKFGKDENGWYLEKDEKKYYGNEYGVVAVLNLKNQRVLIAAGIGGTGTAGACKFLENIFLYEFETTKNKYGEAVLIRVFGDSNGDGIEDETWIVEIV